MRSSLLLLLLAWSTAACGVPRDGGDGGAPADSAVPPYSEETLPPDSPAPAPRVEPLPERPPERVDSVRLEGTWERERLRLVRSPAGFEPPFTTYVPAGLKTEFEAKTDSSSSVRFLANFAGRLNPDAYLQVKVYRAGSSQLLVRETVEAYLLGRDPRRESVRKSEGWPWSLEAWDFHYGIGPSQPGFTGTIAITRHGDRFLHVLAHYPPEYGDGIGPRLQRILEEWRWEDDGESLIPRR